MNKSKTVIYFDRSGNVAKIKSNAGATRNNKAAFYLHCNDVEPTFGMKLRRFFRRLRSELRFRADITVSQVVGSELAAEVPYIGLEEYAGD